jgi:hypothetical protein
MRRSSMGLLRSGFFLNSKARADVRRIQDLVPVPCRDADELTCFARPVRIPA